MIRMRGLLDAGNRALAYGLGLGVLALAAVVWQSGHSAMEIMDRVATVFGLTFLVLLVCLVLAVLFCWVRLREEHLTPGERMTWTEAGLHAAGGIATLALTYTLLGISLGIAGLSGQPLTPETVQTVIQNLTRDFSMAFMTTVVGLPLSAAAQALVRISAQHMTAMNDGDGK